MPDPVYQELVFIAALGQHEIGNIKAIVRRLHPIHGGIPLVECAGNIDDTIGTRLYL